MNRLKGLLKQAVPVLVALAIWELGAKDVVNMVFNNITGNLGQ